ncbi:MFS transporter [Sciscionella marina]|uniref:MFS transporter n=1 Tax=Sciscionella marina TaxID=508770 RepID=UPI00037C10C4|nr:MFS transporter [Sciscionella marina]
MITDENAGTWRELRSYGATVVVLAGGVFVGAVSIYLAASLLPTAVEQIGGGELYAWNMTVFLAGQVIAAMLTATVLRRIGARPAYATGFGVFAAGSVVCALAPAMPLMLAGRGLQGLGAGLLSGLGFALIQASLPSALWSRGTAVISAMFGVGNFVGPAVGGAMAQAGAWRWAFAALAICAVLLGGIAVRVLHPDGVPAQGELRIPVWSLVSVVAATGALSVAGLTESWTVRLALVFAAAVLLIGFVLVESRHTVRVLPVSTYRRGSAMRWVYLTIAVLASAVAVETFLPLFGQRLGQLPPVAAGFYGAALSLGWALTQIGSASARGRAVSVLILAGPAVLTVGLAALTLLFAPNASAVLVLAWLVALLVAGAGIGIAMPHLTARAMSLAESPAEAQQAAAAVATVLTMATATGAAIAVLLVDIGGPELTTAARCLFAGFTIIALLGVGTARLSAGRAPAR